MQKSQQTSAARLGLLGLAALLVTAGIGVRAEEPLARREAPAKPAPASVEAIPAAVKPAAPRLAGGLRVSIDPETGSLIALPPAKARTLELSPALRQAFSTSSEGLVEEALPDGTFRARLEGRFMSATFAAIGEDGTARVGHSLQAVTAPPATAAAEAGEKEAVDEAP